MDCKLIVLIIVRSNVTAYNELLHYVEKQKQNDIKENTEARKEGNVKDTWRKIT
jgi:hypothetical protein